MKKFIFKFLIIFVFTISIAFFALIYAQKPRMQPPPPPMDMPHSPPYSAPMDMPFVEENEIKEPPLTIPLMVIISISLLFILFLIKYMNKNFIKPLIYIEENLKKIKEGSLNVEFKTTESENKEIIDTFLTLDEMVEGLKQKEKLQDNFIQTLSHDLRTPIVAQERAIEILKEEFKDHELLDGLMQNTESYLKMINIVMEACSDKEIKIDKTEFNLSNLANTLLNSMKPMASNKNIELIKDMDDKVNIYADYISINRILTNLISNSIENIPFNRKIALRAKNENNKTKIIIEDNGDGIKEEDIPKLFEKYTSKSKTKLISGLGLYIVHELVEKNQGIIKVESKIGEYTKFIIEFNEKG